ncbi:MAG: anaerobic ribonucleoside-triphosphate reductase activating protein [Halanaerobiales bacterium]|nr:anaerobic ribonucleoside-triphosphate reductase activating protein [Halanaerobiales bacterium]
MKISGIQKTSLIDYPDNIATVLFTQGCNMNCPYCHNPELISETNENEYLNLDNLWEFLDKRSGLIDGVVITGGEPLIQESIYDLLVKIKEYGLLIKLDTNGTNYNLLKKIVENNLIDYIAMDIKGPIKEYDKFCGIKLNKAIIKNIDRSIELLKKSNNIITEMRTTVVPGMHDNNIMKKIAKRVSGVDKFYIQNFRPNKVNNPDFKSKRRYSEEELNEFKNIFKEENVEVQIRN